MNRSRLACVFGMVFISSAAAQEPRTPSGYFVPAQHVTLTSEAAGKVVEVLVKEGQMVKKGQILIRLDRSKETAEVRRTEGLLQAATARFRLAEARVRDVAQGEVTAAQGEAERARIALAAVEIRAPFDGLVLRVNVQPGSFTNPAMLGITTSAGLCELADVSSWRVEVAVNELFIPLYKVGRKCALRPTLVGADPLRGTVERVAPVVDRGRGTVSVTIKVELPADFMPRVDGGVTVSIDPK